MLVSSEANHSTQMPARSWRSASKELEVSQVLSMCQQIQRSKRAREGKREEGQEKKRGRVSDVFRGATSDWNLVPHEPGGYKVNKKGPICPATKWQTTFYPDCRPRWRRDGVQMEKRG